MGHNRRHGQLIHQVSYLANPEQPSCFVRRRVPVAQCPYLRSAVQTAPSLYVQTKRLPKLYVRYLRVAYLLGLVQSELEPS